jgi:hypothetical protein
MEILNHSKAQVTLQSAVSTVLPPLLRAQSLRGVLKHLLLSAGFATAVAGSAAQHVEAAVDSESAAQAEWRTLMAHNPMPVDGCFHASYPNIVWEKVDCKMSPPRVHPTHVRPTGDDAQVTGNGHN